MAHPRQQREAVRLFDNREGSPHLLTAEDLAYRLRVAPKTIRKWRYEDGMPAVKLGKRLVRYSWEEVFAWLQTRGG